MPADRRIAETLKNTGEIALRDAYAPPAEHVASGDFTTAVDGRPHSAFVVGGSPWKLFSLENVPISAVVVLVRNRFRALRLRQARSVLDRVAK